MLSKGVVSKYTSYLYSMSNVSVAVLYSDNIGHPSSISLLLKGCFFFHSKLTIFLDPCMKPGVVSSIIIGAL